MKLYIKKEFKLIPFYMGRQVVYKPLMVSSLILMEIIGIPLIFTIVIKKNK